jgi:molecular chaperone GrpE (heat shock protein)
MGARVSMDEPTRNDNGNEEVEQGAAQPSDGQEDQDVTGQEHAAGEPRQEPLGADPPSEREPRDGPPDEPSPPAAEEETNGTDEQKPDSPSEPPGEQEDPLQGGVSIEQEPSETDAPDLPEAAAAAEIASGSGGEPEQPPVAEDDEPAEVALDDQPPVDPEAVATELQERRLGLIQGLFGQDRPRDAITQKTIADYNEAFQAAVAADVTTVPDEGAELIEQVVACHAAALELEKSEMASLVADMESRVDAHDALFSALAKLTDDVAFELSRLDPENETFAGFSEEMQSALNNHRKGVEIIHRMLSRASERRTEFSKEPPATLTEEMDTPPPPDTVEQTDDFAAQLLERYHSVRETNRAAEREAADALGKCRKSLKTALAALLSAVDGFDAGLTNEGEAKARLTDKGEQEAEDKALVEQWMGVYGRLEEALNAFLSTTGMESHTVERGTPFDPETMEPQGTVEAPDLDNEEVATVVRRGFSLKGEIIRPMFVEVVMNS